PKTDEEIVIEGAIEQNAKPYVIVSHSSDAFATFHLDTAALIHFYLGLKVTISNETTSELMHLQIDSTHFPPVIFTTNHMKGEVGHSYNLKVESAGKIYTAL